MGAVAGLVFLALDVYASEISLGPIRESQAFERFLKRPLSETSKLVYLIDRFRDSEVVVIYDGNHYQGPEAARIARKFLFENYKGESAEVYVRDHCHRSDPGRRLILVRAPSGKVRLARDVLLEELKALDQIKSLPHKGGGNNWSNAQDSFREKVAP